MSPAIDEDPNVLALRESMIAISLRAFAVDWVDHLEYVLWHMVVNGPMRYGRTFVTQSDIDNLRQLSHRCDCWIYVDRYRGEQCVSLIEWQDVYTHNIDLVTLP